MKDRLEDFIRENKRDFDQFEPPVSLWDKIEKQLDEKQVTQPAIKTGNSIKPGFLLKMAASIAFVVCAGLWVYNFQYKQSVDLSHIDPQLAKQQIHYASLIETKRNELKMIEKEEPQLYNEFSAEIKKMDLSYQKLKSDLPASPNQEETVKAMIQNLQIQTELLNQQLNIIQQINKVKKEQRHETQDI